MDQVEKTINELTLLETEAPTQSQRLLDVESALHREVTTVARRERSGRRSKGSLRVEPIREEPVLELREQRRSRHQQATLGQLPKAPTVLVKWWLDRLASSTGWLAAVAVVTAWGWWNGELLLSTGVGVLAMVLAYRMQEWDWQLLKSEVQRFLGGSNRQLIVAVASGGLATLATYMAVSIWADADSHWMAFSMIWQNFGTAAVLGLIAWRALARKAAQDEARLNQMLAALADADPMKRLIAVRQITSLVTHSQVNQTRLKTGGLGHPSPNKALGRSHVAECFRLMLSREPEALVRDAVLDALQALDNFPKLSH